MANYKICGAKRRSDGAPCCRPAGWGTDHAGEGRCKLHGGCSTGAPKGSKNRLGHGANETIYADILTDDEKDFYDQIEPDAVAMLEQSLKVIMIRERRILQRLEAAVEGWTVTRSKTTKVKRQEITDPEKKQAIGFAAEQAGIVYQPEFKVVEETEVTREIEEDVTGDPEVIVALEEVLTKVEKEKARLIQLYYNIKPPKSSGDSLKKLAEILGGIRKARDPDQADPKPEEVFSDGS